MLVFYSELVASFFVHKPVIEHSDFSSALCLTWHLRHFIGWYSSFREGTSAASQNFRTSISVSKYQLIKYFPGGSAFLSASRSWHTFCHCIIRMINLTDELTYEKLRYVQVSFCTRFYISPSVLDFLLLLASKLNPLSI